MNNYDTKLKDIHLKDLIFVILYGGIISILLGVALGLVDFYIRKYTSLSFSMIFFFIAAQYIGRTVRKQYEIPHIVYIVITAMFLALQGLIILLIPSIYNLAINYSDLSILYNLRIYGIGLIQIFKSLFTGFNLWLYLEILILIVGTYVGTKETY